MSDVIVEQRGQLCIITLDRPQTLNALTLNMVQDAHTALAVALANPACTQIAINSSSDRAFCAGGDVRAVSRYKGTAAIGALFFRAEYTLDYAVATSTKPVVTLVDGICMGGGLGLSALAQYSVASERCQIAMPEMAIGLFPDVGAGWFLNRLPAGIGMWMALTGARLTGEQAQAVGLMTHHVHSSKFAEILKRLEKEPAATVLAGYAQPPKPAPDTDWAAKFGAWLPLFENLTDWKLLAELRAKQPGLIEGSPTSLALTVQHMQACKTLALKDVLSRDFRLACGCLRGQDFYEGVRARLADKDNRPRWQPERLAEVTQAMLDKHQQTPFGGELFES